MSPLLFLAIALVVPLLGMIVLGVGARIRHQKVTDDETEPFRRRLESIAPPDAHEAEPSGTPRTRAGHAPAQTPRSASRARTLARGAVAPAAVAPAVGTGQHQAGRARLLGAAAAPDER